jgi:plastocyanin
MKWFITAFAGGMLWLAGAGCARAAFHTVMLLTTPTFSFVPSDITIPAGDGITWAWLTSPHSTTSDTGLWDSGIHNAPFRFRRTFTTPGDYFYHCSVHVTFGMTGVIHVTAGP